MDKNIYLCAGMRRSGSTVLYNILRLIMEHKYGKDSTSAFFYGSNYGDVKLKEHNVIKIHDYNDELCKSSNHIFISIRDFRDVAASMIRRNKSSENTVIKDMTKVSEEFEKYEKYSSYVMVYDTMVNNLSEVIREIIDVLGIDMSESDIDKLTDDVKGINYKSEGKKIRYKKNNFDFNANNLIHKTHIIDGSTGYYVDYLSKDIIKEIEEKFPKFCIIP